MGRMGSDGRFNPDGADHVSDYPSSVSTSNIHANFQLQGSKFHSDIQNRIELEANELDTAGDLYESGSDSEETTRFPDLLIEIPSYQKEEPFGVPPELEAQYFELQARESRDWVCSLSRMGLVFREWEEDERIPDNCKELKILLGSSSFLNYFITDKIVRSYLDLYYLVDAYSIVLAYYNEDSNLSQEITDCINKTVELVFQEYAEINYTREQFEDEVIRLFNALAIFRADQIHAQFASESNSHNHQEPPTLWIDPDSLSSALYGELGEYVSSENLSDYRES